MRFNQNLLILCDMFPPAFGPRMGYLCKYLTRMGWRVTVVTEQIPEKTFSFLAGEAEVTYINYYQAKGRIAQRIEWVGVMLLDLLFHYKDRRMERVAKRLLRDGDYRAILCSTYRAFPLPAARRLAERSGLPLVVDLRDIVEQYPKEEYVTHRLFPGLPLLDKAVARLFRHRLLADRNRALRMASAVTTVSPWHVELLKRYNPQVKLIYNGFDPELFYPKKVVSERFEITYTGRLLSLAIRDPELLFRAIARLNEEGHITPERLRVVWYIDEPSRPIIEREAERLGVSDFMEYHGYVDANEIPAILNRSSVLLSLANKCDAGGPKGVMTTKLFEFLAVEKPILCVRSDEACLAETIRETHSGLAATDTDEVCRFLLHYYEQWQRQGYTEVSVNRSQTARYSREEQAKQFVQLIEQL